MSDEMVRMARQEGYEAGKAAQLKASNRAYEIAAERGLLPCVGLFPCVVHLDQHTRCEKTPTRLVPLVVNATLEVPMCAEHEAFWQRHV